jgi:uncharacterized membrane protein YphA (DoxX/SURF4 family)
LRIRNATVRNGAGRIASKYLNTSTGGSTMTTATTSTVPQETQTRRRIAARIPTVARILMGVLFFVFGLNGFLNFIPQPATPPPEPAMAFAGALMATGYMFPLIKSVEVLVGALLLSNRYVPLALALIAPIVVNIFAFHAFLAPSGIALAIVVLALELLVAWSFRGAFRSMLVSRAAPQSLSRPGVT